MGCQVYLKPQVQRISPAVLLQSGGTLMTLHVVSDFYTNSASSKFESSDGSLSTAAALEFDLSGLSGKARSARVDVDTCSLTVTVFVLRSLDGIVNERISSLK